MKENREKLNAKSFKDKPNFCFLGRNLILVAV